MFTDDSFEKKGFDAENFSAEDYGWVITHKDSGLRTDSFRTKSQAEKYRDELKQNKTLRTGMKIVKANSNDEPITPNILNYLDVKEAEFDFIHCSNCLFSKTGLNRCEVCNTEFVCRSQHGEDCNCYLFTAESFEARGGKRMYCPNCKTNRTWNRGFKKQNMDYSKGEKPRDFIFYVCQKCNYAYDPKTGKKMEDNWREMFGYDAETFGAETERVCDYCEREAKDMGMVTFPDGLAVCDICFEEQSGELNAESYSADESLPNFVAFGDGDAISYSQCLTCSKVGDYDDDQELCNSCNMKYDYRYSPVAGFYLNAESFGAESSGLTRLPSDEPNFSPQKADRNKDGEISSWERTVGNKVAKGSEGRKTSSKGIDAFAEPFEEIGISKPYARLGVIAAGITALAFGVNKLRK